MGQAPTEQKSSTPHELTPRDDAKKTVSEVLKRVDQLIRKGDLERAQQEIQKAREIDPRNVYTLALDERISLLKAEYELTKEVQYKTEPSKPLVKEKPPQSEPQAEKSRSNPSVPGSKPQTTPPAPVPAEPKFYKPQPEERLDRTIELDAYRKALHVAWHDGALSQNEERQLQELREVLEISDAEHEQLSRDVRNECYKNALKQHLSKTVTSPSIASLKELRNMFHISENEHLKIESELLSSAEHIRRDKILVIDDDTRLLEVLSSSLEEEGFDVTALSTSDEAYALLRKFIPDLILCDINLETSTMGGFTFYEKVKEFKSLQYTPFIFLTGLTDEALVRTGKELGVDDYLTKPVSQQTLLSTLRGKLKRFKQLQKSAGLQPPDILK